MSALTNIKSSEDAAPAEEGGPPSPQGETIQVVGFHLGDEEYGLDIMRVQEIILLGPITLLPQVPDYVRGLINLRGRVLPVFDLRKRFGLSSCPSSDEQRIVIANIGGRIGGIIVDSVSQVARFPVEAVEPPPKGVMRPEENALKGIIKSEGRMVILLDIDLLLGDEIGGIEAPCSHSEKTENY